MTDKKIRKRNMLSKEPIIKALKTSKAYHYMQFAGTKYGIIQTLIAFGWTEDEANRIIEECSYEAQ